MERRTVRLVYRYGADILRSQGMRSEEEFMQHGTVNCRSHSVQVALESVHLARKLRLRVDMSSLVRGALLHDYFLYDWHDASLGNRLHGFRHAGRALENARRDFSLTVKEQNIIARHMFPLNWRPPRCLESWLVCLADKICATRETFSPHRFSKDSLGKKRKQ